MDDDQIFHDRVVLVHPVDFGSPEILSSSQLNAQPHDPVQARQQTEDESWELNYREAAIYLEEGENNDKLSCHPENRDKLKHYFLARSRWFNSLILFAAISIMSLGLIEGPGTPLIHVNAAICVCLEMVLLSVFAFELFVRYQWQGAVHYFHHIRTVLKTFIVVISFARALLVLILNSAPGSFMGLTLGLLRALRPIFLLDCQYAGGTRRFVRQLMQTLPRAGMMLCLLCTLTLVFAITGTYLFSGISDYSEFATVRSSYESLFILFTASNFPAVMLPAYNVSKWFAWYFIIYLVIAIYIVANLLFAVVFDWFTQLESQKLKKLFLHRRRACKLAFDILANRSDREAPFVSLKHFEGLLRFYRPSSKRIDVYLAYRSLLHYRDPLSWSPAFATNTSTNTNKSFYLSCNQIQGDPESQEPETGEMEEDLTSQRLTLDAFYGVYQMTRLNWRMWQREFDSVWYDKLEWTRLRAVLSYLRSVAESTVFYWLINAVIVANCAMLLTATLDADQQQVYVLHGVEPLWLSLAFTFIYSCEIVFKLTTMGCRRFLASTCNLFDLTTVSVIVLATIVDAADKMIFGANLVPDALVLIVLPLRLFRILNACQLYRELVATIAVLAPRMRSALIVVCLVYYVFGVIGNELFANLNLVNCCRNTSIADFYRDDNSTFEQGYYYLLTFDNAVSASVTLFHLMVVNDWYITMTAYAIVTDTDWTRLYFTCFYLITMVLLSMIVSFILDAFVFHMRYSRSGLAASSGRICRIELNLSHAECVMCASTDAHGEMLMIGGRSRLTSSSNAVDAHFIGERRREPFEFSLQMHADVIGSWINESETETSRS